MSLKSKTAMMIVMTSMILLVLLILAPYGAAQQSTNTQSISLGSSIYSEFYEMKYLKSVGNEKFVGRFEGNGTLISENGTMIKTIDHGVVFGIKKPDGTTVTYGRMAVRTPEGFASIIFHEKVAANSEHAAGIGFVTSRASGDLERWHDGILVFRGKVDLGGKSGTLTFWRVDEECVGAFECYPLE